MVTGGEVDCRVARWEARRPVRNSSHVTDQGVHDAGTDQVSSAEVEKPGRSWHALRSRVRGTPMAGAWGERRREFKKEL